MKMKLKFDKKLILGFFVQHGEKIALAGVAVCALVLIYLATRGEKFDKTPASLAQTATDANRVIDQADPTVKLKIKQPWDQIQAIADPTVKPYELVTLLTPLTSEPKTLRGEPVLLTVEQLRGTGGAGRFNQTATGGAMAGIGPEGAAPTGQQQTLGQRWALITGVVNYEKLQKSFYECFKGTKRHTEADYYPVVLGFDVRRAEVTSESEPIDNLKWSQPYRDWSVEYSKYVSTIDVAENRFLHPPLVFPLPPRFDGQSWGKEAVHPPEVPLFVFDPTAQGQGLQAAMEGGIAHGGGRMIGGPGLSRLGTGVPMGGPMAGELGGEVGVGGPGMTPGVGLQAGFPGGAAPAGTPVGPILLFRFFDYNVEPGKRYRYEARLIVSNPNYRYSAQDLDKDLRDRMQDPNEWQETLRSPWSDPSDVVFVPRDDRLLAVSVTSSKGIDRDPWGNVMAVHWDVQKGEEVHGEFKVYRGFLANFLDQKVAVTQPQSMLAGGGGMLEAGGGERGQAGLGVGEGTPGRARRPPRGRQPAPQPVPGPPAAKPETVDYVTDMLVLDLRGGERLPGRSRLAWPGEMLLLDPDGNLQVRSDVDDSEACLAQKSPSALQPGMAPIMGAPITEGEGLRGVGGGGHRPPRTPR